MSGWWRIPTLPIVGGVLAAAGAWGVVLAAARGVEELAASDARPASRGRETGAPHEEPLRSLDGRAGFVVWESNRDGRWRLWTRSLALDAAPRELTPADPSPRQCCPQVSPDGRLLAYLSLPAGDDRYPPTEAGELRLLELESGEVRSLANGARTYGENRAVAWTASGRLAYIDGSGRTVEVGIEPGVAASPRTIVTQPDPQVGLLPSPDLTHATSGWPTFSPLQAGRVEVARVLGGCQPIFSPDSRFGLWVSGAGGPVSRIDLATRQIATVLEKNDPALPPGQGYVYFPSLSPDASLLAVGASRDEHNHFTSDYDIFLLELDPRTLEPVGRAARLTEHPATDRFPTVWAAPLALGRFEGEAPLVVEVDPPHASPWRLITGDRTLELGAGERARLELEAPGRYPLQAVAGGRELAGLAVVRPAAPPQLVGVEWRGEQLVVIFDESLGASPAASAAGRGPLRVDLSGDRRLVSITAASPLPAGSRLRLVGVVDTESPPHAADALELVVPELEWPAAATGIDWAWGGGEDPGGAAPRELPLEPAGLARFDRNLSLQLHGDGGFWLPRPTVEEVIGAFQAANRLRLELVVEPAARRSAGPILALSAGRGRGRRLLVLEETVAGALDLVLTTAGEGPETSRTALGVLPAGPSHWSLAWQPGSITAWRDGRRVLSTESVQGDFFHWKPRPFAVGIEPDHGAWRGTVHALALGTGGLDDQLAGEAVRRWAARVEGRPKVERVAVAGTIRALAGVPTLDEITPYRDALRVVEVEVQTGGRFPAGEVLAVVERVLLDGRRLPAAERRVGERVELVIEPFAAQPQLQATYVAEDGLDAPRWFAP